MTMRYGDVIIGVIISALKKIHKQVAYRLSIGSGEIPGCFRFIS